MWAATGHAAVDAKHGLVLARQWCSTCHTVEPQGSASDKAPAFATIAERRDQKWVKAWLSDPHPPMQGITLTRVEIDDLTAYIESLAPKAPAQ
jgi:mono/diheme cytochrome c family protein